MKIVQWKRERDFTSEMWHILDDGGEKAICGYNDSETDPTIQALTKSSSSYRCSRCRNIKNHNFDVETISAGQQRKYADSLYIYHITDFAKEKRTKEEVLSFAIENVKSSYSPDDEKANWASPLRKELFQKDNGTWVYHVEEAYTG